ncbi:MAG: tetratricopeptide repeat protein [Planctomycetaceae bacterium]|nr:tetratricopeptide repeat protein [Planctomycetaceae bacterium]
MTSASPWIRTTTVETFRADVIDESQKCPVVIDFWAEWCGPCRQLMPILEKLADEFAGRFILMKINVDELPEIAGAFGVQSIPFVVAMLDGQPVAQLPGVQSEHHVRQWLESFVPSPATEAYNAGLQAEGSGDLETAEKLFRDAASHDPETSAFQIALARVLLGLNREQECGEIMEALEARGYLEPEAQSLKEQLEMRHVVEDSGGTAEARKALDADPNNRELQILLAEALSVDKRYAEACDLLLNIISTDYTPVRDKAKEAMVTILSAMGPKSKQAADYRRKLATAFY